jgi:hypothetical protein
MTGGAITVFDATLVEEIGGVTSAREPVHCTSASGSFEFTDLDASGRYRVSVEAWRHARASSEWVGPPDSGSGLEVYLQPLGTLLLEFAGALPSASSNVIYRVVAKSEPPLSEVRTGVSDELGMARLDNLAPGSYTVEVRVADEWKEACSAEVLPGQEVHRVCSVPPT